MLRPRRFRLHFTLGCAEEVFRLSTLEAFASSCQFLILSDPITSNRVYLCTKGHAPAHRGHRHCGGDAAAFAPPNSGGIIKARPHRTNNVARLNVTSGNQVLPNVSHARSTSPRNSRLECRTISDPETLKSRQTLRVCSLQSWQISRNTLTLSRPEVIKSMRAPGS